MKYRAEIDGLRALAVIPVILFHAGFEQFSGGFVGVDIFFVISGYLITTLLIEDIENQQFSLFDFYERRARRILPALLLVMLCCIPFAWAWLPPQAMKDFSQSLLATSSFSSNILFWLKSGYFDSANELKPLLHTWSLAVEEQYYVLFPLFLLSLWRFGKARLFWIIATLAALSLLLSEWGSRHSPTANFYLTPTRVWELFAGALTAFIVQGKGSKSNNALALSGLAAVVVSIFAFDENTPFPSLYALAPILGTVLILIYANNDTYVAKLLSTRVFVGLGLVSYSAYLWHQPILAFYRHATVEQNTVTYIVLIGVTIILAYLSWRYVEQPFRSRTRINRSKFFWLTSVAIISVCTFGIMGNASDGFAKKRNKTLFKDLAYNSSRLDYIKCPEALSKTTPTLDYCHGTSDKPNALLIGDSHADDKFYGIAKALNQYQWRLIGNPACPPIMGVKFEAANGIACTERLKKIFAYLENQTHIELVVLSFSHAYPLDSFVAADHVQSKHSPLDAVIEDIDDPLLSRVDTFYAGLERTLKFLQKLDIKTVITIDTPELTFFPVDCVTGRVSCKFLEKDVLTRQLIHRAQLEKLAALYTDIRIYDPIGLFCKNKQCSILRDGHTLYRDSDHLSLYGSEYYGIDFAIWLEQQGQ